MRKIEKQMIQALNTGALSWSKDNTRISSGSNGVRYVWLHNNHIATVTLYPTGFLVEVNKETLRRWPTLTTASRLRALGVNLNIFKGVPHIDSKPV